MTNVETRVLLSEAQDRVRALEDQVRIANDALYTARQRERAADARVTELGAENATLREQLTGMWQRLALVAGLDEQPADCTTDAAWLALFVRLSDVMAEGARELAQAKADTSVVAAQGLATLAFERAKHAKQDAAVEAELAIVQDGLSRMQAEGWL